MFSVAVYYLTSVQDTSATPGPCSRTARRYTLLGIHWRTCGVRTSRSSSLTCGLQTDRTWIQSITLFGVPFSSADGLSTSTIHDSQPANAGDRHWVGENCRSVSMIAPLVSGVASLSASSSSKADTLNIWCKNCMKWQLTVRGLL